MAECGDESKLVCKRNLGKTLTMIEQARASIHLFAECCEATAQTAGERMESFSFSRQNTPFSVVNEMFSRAAEENARKYYGGEATLCDRDPSPHFELKMLLSAPYPMGIVTSRANFIFGRAWSHIRDNKENIVTLRYVKAGTISISQGGSSSVMTR
jgi:hypothetical protein